MTNEKIREIFEDIFFEEDYINTSRLHCPEFETNELENEVVSIFGGMNGCGEWKDYFYDLYELIDALQSNGIHASVIKIDVDNLDDMFRVKLELTDSEKYYKDKPE